MFVDFVGITDRSVVFSELLMVAGVFFFAAARSKDKSEDSGSTKVVWTSFWSTIIP